MVLNESFLMKETILRFRVAEFGLRDEELHCLVEIRNEQQSEIWRTKNALQTYSDQIKN